MPAAVSAPPSPTHHPHHHGHDSSNNSPPPSRDDDTSSSCSAARHTFTHLTYSRHHLVDIARETINITKNGRYTNSRGDTVELKSDLDYSVEHCVHYEDEFDFFVALKQYDADQMFNTKGTTAIAGGGSMRGLVRAGSGSQRSLSGGAPSLGSLGEDEKKSCCEDGLLAASLNSSNHELKLSFQGYAGLNSLQMRARFPRTSFLVVSASWLESASELLHAHVNDERIRVGVLNSASGTTPGGRYLKGTVSQEDCLCRASLLYSCISQPKFQSEGRFYGKNRSLRYGSSNCVIFSPDVPVIREDTVQGKLLDCPQKVSFVTIPAPNAFTTSSRSGKEYNDIESEQRAKGLKRHARKASVAEISLLPTDGETDFDEKFEQKRRALLGSLSDRIHRALSAFALGSCTDLVLPAFGCGVHGNDPTMVASVFREMLTDPKQFGGRFRTVVFAIPPCRKQNYQEFAAYFQNQETVKRVNSSRGAATVD